jgi:hypothetical protein
MNSVDLTKLSSRSIRHEMATHIRLSRVATCLQPERELTDADVAGSRAHLLYSVRIMREYLNQIPRDFHFHSPWIRRRDPIDLPRSLVCVSVWDQSSLFARWQNGVVGRSLQASSSSAHSIKHAQWLGESSNFKTFHWYRIQTTWGLRVQWHQQLGTWKFIEKTSLGES